MGEMLWQAALRFIRRIFFYSSVGRIELAKNDMLLWILSNINLFCETNLQF